VRRSETDIVAGRYEDEESSGGANPGFAKQLARERVDWLGYAVIRRRDILSRITASRAPTPQTA
jgi:hypothetical protein